MRKFKKSKHSKREFNAEGEKKKLSVPIIFALATIIIMVASGIGYMWGESGSIRYNKYKFEQTSDGWAAKIDGMPLKFYVLPQETESIPTDKAAIDALKSTKMIYITSDLDSPFSDIIGLMTYELQNDFQKKGLYSILGFTASNDYAKEVITCMNATPNVPVLYLTNSTNTSISFENNCMIMGTNSGYNFKAMRDRILYGFFGVIE
jgi:hypothetical protein